jgi:hypothetical protein
MTTKEKEIEQEKNALTVMPLPVRIPALWYDILPKVLPLIGRTSERDECCLQEETMQVFLRKWKQVLIRREENFVWLHLGGVACHEVLPNFVKTVRDKIIHRDTEIKGKYGVNAVAQHWRTCIQEIRQLDDDTVLKIRNETLHLLHPDLWHDGLGKAWSLASERANTNLCNIRPAIQRWIAKHESQCDLGKPFAGRLSENMSPITGHAI